MSILKLKSAPLLVLEDDNDKNIIPLMLELAYHSKCVLNLFCYEQPVSNWQKVFKDLSNIVFYDEFSPDQYLKYTSTNCCVIVDSVNQMGLCLGWSECLNNLNKLQIDPNVERIILILHKDCLSHYSKLQVHLNHIASAIVSYNRKDPFKIKVQIKKGGRMVKTEEELLFDDKTNTLKSTPIIKEVNKDTETDKPLPENLSTFKIEVGQTEKLEKYKLKLPYMSKINEGESKVYYEPDAVDDWDEEDPDEDLDI